MSQPTQPDWGVLYIEMDEQHIFVLRATVRGGQRDGLYVYERMKGGRELWSPLAPPFLRSQIIWTAEGRQMDFLRYDGEPLQSCSTLGFAQQLMPATCEDQDLYERTDWCNAVHVDTRTGSLCLAGDQGGLMVIPDYKEAFRRPCPASSPSEEEPQPGIPTIGVGADISRSIYPYLAVADGIAAFTCAADSLPVWIDLEKLICSRHNEDIDCEASEVILPTLSTFYPGDPLLMDCCGYDFTGAQCMQIDARQLVMTCRTMTDVETGRFGGFRYQSRSIALRLDLGDILKAKLAQPSQPFERQAYQTRVHFPRRTAAQEAEKASWRRLQDQDPEVKLHLPSSDFITASFESWKDSCYHCHTITVDDEVRASGLGQIILDEFLSSSAARPPARVS
ncbi:hypothetical protein BDZ90DRAFT_54564 [Jaminaea rosea]|uniref:Uncharacterized protein n=1 Tax=Jaminaea rosea TaxID=1569628 RepID=A0A316US38_9BASI|nr:hypothetical protein BDZ90DRAFT_54564 [Jaminaea rosea]PWN25945.1 hypothetical protein BDZ90DRAFT_54564 [Jaminaea rosea]